MIECAFVGVTYTVGSFNNEVATLTYLLQQCPPTTCPLHNQQTIQLSPRIAGLSCLMFVEVIWDEIF